MKKLLAILLFFFLLSPSVSQAASILFPTGGGTGTNTIFTQGSIPYAGANGIYTQNNAALFWNGSQLGIGTNAPDQTLTVAGGNMDLFPVFGSVSSGNSTTALIATKLQGGYFYFISINGASSSLANRTTSTFGLGNGSSITNANLANAKDLDVQGNVAAAISNTGGTSVLSLFNITNPGVLALYSNTSETVNIVNGKQVFIQGDYVFVNNDNNTVSSYDISNKAAPVFLQKLAYNTGTGGSFLTANSAIGKKMGNFLYFANADTAGNVDFSVVNITNPRAMVVTRVTDIATGTNFSSSSVLADISVNNNQLYTLDATNGIVVYQIRSNIADIIYQSNTTTNISTPSKIIAHGYYVYVLDATAQKIYLYSSDFFTVTYQAFQNLGFAYNYFDVSNGYICLVAPNRLGLGSVNQIFTPTIKAGDTNFGNLYVSNDTLLENNLVVLGGANFASAVNMSMTVNIDPIGVALSVPNGNINIGTQTNAARLHLPAGTATAGTAPLMLTTGTNLTAAAAGAMEYATPDLFFTPGSAIRYNLPLVTGAGVQGDLVYASGASIYSRLAKDTNATRYLSNTGTTNNPAWAQIDLTNGVTGTLPTANGGTGGNFTFAATNFTPTATNVTNITSSTPNNTTYQRVGNIITVFGTITITNTLAVASEVDVALPVASNLAAATDLNGTGTMDSTASVNLYIKADATNDRASIFFTSAGVGQTSTIYYSYQYKVI